MFGVRSRPERRSSAGVWIAPAGARPRPAPAPSPGARRRCAPRRRAPRRPRSAPCRRGVLDEDPRAGVVGVLRARSSPSTAWRRAGSRSGRAGRPPRVAAAHVARHRRPSASRASSSPARMHLRRARTGCCAPALTPIRSQTASRLLRRSPRREAGDAVAPRPLRAHVVGRAERGRVVDDRAAAEARCRRAGRRSGRRSPRRRRSGTGARSRDSSAPSKSSSLVVAAGLEHDHVEPGLRRARPRPCRRRRPSRRRTTSQSSVGVARRRRAASIVLRRRVLGRPERARVADRVPDRVAVAVRAGQAVVDEQRALAQRLEGGAPLGQAAVAPGQQHALALAPAGAR